SKCWRKTCWPGCHCGSKHLGERCDGSLHHPDGDKLTTEFNGPPSSTAHLAQRIADDMALLHHHQGDGVSDELGISISYLIEQFALLAAAYRSPAEMEIHHD